jgi:hypothetical protein
MPDHDVDPTQRDRVIKMTMIIPTSPSSHTYSVELRFFGDFLDPAEITAILGLRPSIYSSNEEPLLNRKRQPFRGYNGSEHPDFQAQWQSLEDGLAFVACRLAPLKSEIVQLSKRFDGLWWCGHFQSSFDGGPTLSPGLLANVASYGCPLYLDNYHTIDNDGFPATNSAA